jgi:hypothetical protein
MKLTYRGVSYDYNPPQIEVSDSNTVGKYRGLDVRFRNPQKAIVLQPTLDLKYRGAAYSNQPAVEPSAIPSVEPAVPVVEPVIFAPASASQKARLRLMNQHRATKQRQQMMLTRLAIQVGLPAAEAAHYWNHIQGKLHPSFAVDYDRSSAAFS